MIDRERRRVLVVAPSGRDGALAHQLLGRVGLDSMLCPSVHGLCEEARRNVGVCVIAEEAFDDTGIDAMSKLIDEQPAWSDLPIVFINNRRPSKRQPRFEQLLGTANVNFLERPLHASSFISAIKSALRARDRQYAAERAILQRDGFLAMLSHELRNPLASIVLGLDVLRADDVTPGDRDVQLERLARQSRHLTHLIADLLEVSRITAGRIVLQQRPVSVGDVLVAAIAGLPGDDDRARVTHHPARDALVVRGDELRLQQVFTNLLTNALKYTPAPGRITASVRRDGPHVRVTITDEGIGIAADMLPRIFDLFVQADGALARSQGGMGIGLTLAKDLITLHGGNISAASAGIGCGSTFTVSLPLIDDQPLAQALPDAPHASAAPRRILVIEDSDDLRDTMRMLLERAGHAISVANDGAAGLEMMLAKPPDIAFIDIGLPELDGYEVARRARARLGSTVVLVALSGYGRPEDKARAKAAGFDVHLTKPIDGGTLLRTVGT